MRGGGFATSTNIRNFEERRIGQNRFHVHFLTPLFLNSTWARRSAGRAEVWWVVCWQVGWRGSGGRTGCCWGGERGGLPEVRQRPGKIPDATATQRKPRDVPERGVDGRGHCAERASGLGLGPTSRHGFTEAGLGFGPSLGGGPGFGFGPFFSDPARHP